MEVCGSVDACEIDVTERMVESIREWGRMLAFTSELPLPLPPGRRRTQRRQGRHREVRRST